MSFNRSQIDAGANVEEEINIQINGFLPLAQQTLLKFFFYLPKVSLVDEFIYDSTFIFRIPENSKSRTLCFLWDVPLWVNIKYILASIWRFFLP